MLKPHTNQSYEHELRDLRERVLIMGARVESMIDHALKAFRSGDTDLARDVVARDHDVDELELDIDDRCLRVLARRQPVASDLRFITTALKVVTDLERIGDLAANVAERAVELGGQPRQAFSSVIPKMGDLSREMLRDALDALGKQDAILAKSVLERDHAVDSLFEEVFPELMRETTLDADSVFRAQRLQSVARYFERVADHATNLAEMVVFMVEGEDVRHPACERSDANAADASDPVVG